MVLCMKKGVVCWFIISFFIACGGSDEVAIVKNGRSSYVIVFEGGLDDGVANYPTKIFQEYVHKITGCELPIVSVFPSGGRESVVLEVDDSLHEQQIVFQTKGNNLWISSGSLKGLSNAVYEFLEQNFDCKWYAPDASQIPNRSTLLINKELYFDYTPPIHTRTVHARLFYENPLFADQHKVTTGPFPYYVPIARVHTFHKMLPQDKFYKNNPEYFALRGDRRLPTQLCLTNEKVYEIVRDSVASFFRKYPKARVLSVSPDDNTQYCQCENCEAVDREEGSHSGSLIRFVNRVARHFPDKTISTLAYQYTRKPCKTKPLKNVLITLCSIECDRSASITEKCKEFAKDLKGWSALTDNIRIWDYTTQFTNFLAPFPNIHTIEPNIKFFKRSNARWVFEQHSNNPSELFELRAYLMAKLLWNPEMKSKDIIFEFTEGYYKQAGIYVRKYIDLIHRQMQKDKDFFLFLYGDPSQGFKSFLRPELMKQYLVLFNKAALAVSDNKELLGRVWRAGIGVDYAFLEMCRTNSNPDFSLYVFQNGEKKANYEVLKKLEHFESVCNQYNITAINEMGYKVSEYVADYRKMLKLALQPNKAQGKVVKLLTKPKKYAQEDPQTLTDGALGGANFYANWLGFEGNHMEVIVDLEKVTPVQMISTAFLQVTNHVVFFPKKVVYLGSADGKKFREIATLHNKKPLQRKSKINDTQNFKASFKTVRVRYIKVYAENMRRAPYWHLAAGLPSWIFADEIFVD